MKLDERAHLMSYREVAVMWMRGFDTAAIAQRLSLPEHLVARWVWNFREQVRAVTSPRPIDGVAS